LVASLPAFSPSWLPDDHEQHDHRHEHHHDQREIDQATA
jgi:hypothetical protein